MTRNNLATSLSLASGINVVYIYYFLEKSKKKRLKTDRSASIDAKMNSRL